MAEPESLSPLPQPGSSDQQQIASASILLQIVMLGVAFVLGHLLRRHKIYYINEASASLLLGQSSSIFCSSIGQKLNAVLLQQHKRANPRYCF